jgi:hypothetical protein
MMKEDQESVGLGKVIYNVDDEETRESKQEERIERAELDEADHESFPASDPPGFAGGKRPDSLATDPN